MDQMGKLGSGNGCRDTLQNKSFAKKQISISKKRLRRSQDRSQTTVRLLFVQPGWPDDRRSHRVSMALCFIYAVRMHIGSMGRCDASITPALVSDGSSIPIENVEKFSNLP